MVPRPGNSGCAIVLAGTKQPRSILVIDLKDASGATTAIDERTPRDEPISAKVIITHSDARVDRSIHFDDSEASDQDCEEDGNADDNDGIEYSHEAEERSLHVGHVINPRGVDRPQADESDEEEDGCQGVAPGERPPRAPRATMNAETPMANRALCLLTEDLKKSRWIQLFHPNAAYQATWENLGN